MVEIASAAGGEDHGFRFIQLPFNLAMAEALLKRNQKVNDEFISLIDAASVFGISLIASASTLQGRASAGLSDDVRKPLGSLSTDAQTAIQFVRSTPGITTALVGMSRVEHVEENMKLRELPAVAAADYARVISGLTT
jgi:predicted aldo/keto reductase-like oxidoreductase